MRSFLALALPALSALCLPFLFAGAEARAGDGDEVADADVAPSQAATNAAAFACYRIHDESLCTDAGLAEGAVNPCLHRCRSAVRQLEDTHIRATLVGCESEFVNNEGRAPPVCRLRIDPGGAVDRSAWNRTFPRARNADCMKECARRGRAYLVHAHDHIKCVDGTRSPTCTCDRDSFSGCCSHHGGIADDNGCPPEIHLDWKTPIPNTSSSAGDD